MEKINRGNYESWMLDYAEGSLSAKDRAALEAFLAVNTDLRSELDEYEAIIVPKPAHNSPGWEALKQPNLAALNMDISAREQLYFRAVEGQINAAERSLLDDLLRKPVFAAEHQLWMKSRLVPGAENVDHEQLYQFGLDLPVSESNFEYHLIALTEGLLSEAQCRALTEFAERQPSKQRELALAEKLRLAPAAGIFYPDKDKLYQLK